MKLLFRAFHKDSKEMLQALTMEEICTFEQRLTKEEYRGIILTQSTGFHDKIEVEIFLGDIVKDSNGDEYEIIFHDGAIMAGRIVFDNNAIITKRDELLFYLNAENAKSVKVVSNIFERGKYEKNRS